MVEHHPGRALSSLQGLVNRVQSEAIKSVVDWHLEQTLGVVSIVQSQLKDHRRSAKTLLQIAERHQQQVSYYRRGLVSSCATAALELASAGDRIGAVRALGKAASMAAGMRPADKLFRKAQKVVGAMPRRKSGASTRATAG
jgi:hypothetical protein